MKIGLNSSYSGVLMEAGEQKALSHPLTKESTSAQKDTR